MSTDPAASLRTAADLLEDCAGHLDVCGDGPRASYGDTPLDDPVAGFVATWTPGLLACSDLLGQLEDYTAQIDGAADQPGEDQ